MKTFVVRVFVPADGSDVPLRGVVDPVGTGRLERFRDGEGLLELVRSELEREREVGAAGVQEARSPRTEH